MKHVSEKQLLNLLLNVAGSVLLAFGVCAFILPFDLIVGGATGISLILHRLTKLPVSVFSYAINLGMLPLGLIFGGKDGKRLVAGSVLSSVITPTALAVFERIPGITAIADSTLMAALCGGVVCGAGVGLVMRSGGSTGGLDIPVILLHRRLRVPQGNVLRAADSLIMLGQIPLSGLTNIIYGLFYTYIMTGTINSLVTYGENRIRLGIVSEHFEELREALIENDFGVTLLLAESGYTNTSIKKLETVMLQAQYRRAYEVIQSVDPEAFITIEHVKDVRGRGFTMERIPLEKHDNSRRE